MAAERKWCPRCMEMLPIAQFGTNSNSDGGLQSCCRECFRIYMRERRRRIKLGLPTAVERIRLQWNINDRIAEIEERTAQDLSRNGSAFSDGGIT